jgi:hypothetical protein
MHKRTKILYQFDVTESGFVGTTSGTGADKKYHVTVGAKDPFGNDVPADMQGTVQATSPELAYNACYGEIDNGSTITKNSDTENYFSLKSWSNVDEAKSAMLTDNAIAQYNRADTIQWALTDSNKGLKVTMEFDTTDTSLSVKDQNKTLWDGDDYHKLTGFVQVISTDHLF